MTTTKKTVAHRPDAAFGAAPGSVATGAVGSGLLATAVLVAAVLATALLTTPVTAQVGAPPAATEAATLGAELVGAQEAHLWRVAGWGGASLLAGIGLLAAADRQRQPGWHGFGVQAAAWGAINLGIVAWAFTAGIDAPDGTLAGALAAEDAYGNILLVNLGLNVGYMAVGGALALAASHGLTRADAVRGHGLGVVVQGLGLLALDGIAYAGSRARMGSLRSLVERVEVGAAPGTVDVTLVSLGL
jgi:hypothetical protein